MLDLMETDRYLAFLIDFMLFVNFLLSHSNRVLTKSFSLLFFYNSSLSVFFLKKEGKRTEQCTYLADLDLVFV